MTNDYLLISPEIILLVTGLLVLFLDAFSEEIGISKGNLAGLTIFGSALSIFATIFLLNEQAIFFNIYSIDCYYNWNNSFCPTFRINGK